jgi:hypothetical protein
MPGKTERKSAGVLAGLTRAKAKSFEACPGALHGSDAVATGGRFGQSWRAWKETAERSYGGGQR